MDSTSLASILPKPRHRRAHLVESLYGDRFSFLIGGLAIVAAASLTAWRTGESSIWFIAAAIGMMTMVRLASFEIFLANERHADRHPVFWKQLYSILAVFHLALIGSWATLVYWTANDPFSDLLSVMACTSFLIGTQGRNFSSILLVRLQLIACLVPILIAFYARSPSWVLLFPIFLLAFYSAVVQTSKRIRELLRGAIEASEENWRLAHIDPLTRLANRPSMQTAIERAIEERIPFALLLVNLEGFKRVNDTLGHIAGDRMLRQAAERLQRTVGAAGLLARTIENEFRVLLLIDGPHSDPKEVAESICEALGQPATINGATMPSSASVGIARYPKDGNDYAALSHRADMALFEAQSGTAGNVVEYEPGTPDRAADRLRMESDLRKALAEHSIQLYFQPIVENRSFRVVGCEALARWHHPLRGSVSPAEFLIVAEDVGLMDELTDQTFDAGCRAAAIWPSPIRLSINLSPNQLRRPDLLATISNSLARANMDPSRLEIEITENVLLDGRPDVIETLQRIRALGVRLSLDDFGTGYSNLGQIALLPINKIKLDKSFLIGIGEDRRRTAVFHGAVQFIAQLGLEIVLEGVETEEHLRFASAEQNISLLQGYAFGAAMPGDAIIDFLRTAPEDQGNRSTRSTGIESETRSRIGKI